MSSETCKTKSILTILLTLLEAVIVNASFAVGEVAQGSDITGVFGIPFGEELTTASDKTNLSANKIVSLREPIFGVQRANVSCDISNRVFKMYIRGNFRRGLPRVASLEKIKALRERVAASVGFDIGEYRFATAQGDAGVLTSNGGEAVWLDMDTVYAECKATNRDVMVTLKCSVNPVQRSVSTSRRRLKEIEKESVGDEQIYLDSKIPFVVTVSKISLEEAENRRMTAVFEERRVEQARASRLEKLKLTDLFGIRFDETTNISTSQFVRIDGQVSVISGNDTNNYMQAHWVHIDKNIKPTKFFDFAKVVYSYESIIVQFVEFYGHFSTNLSRQDAIEMLDEFSRELSNKYGIVLGSNLAHGRRDEIETEAKTDSSIPDGYDGDQYAILPESCYYCREFQNANMFVRLYAGKTSSGARCLVLKVHNFNKRIGRDEGMYEE